MGFSKLLLSLLAASSFAVCQPSNDRRQVITANTIVSDINAINTGVQHARAGIAGYNGGLISETPIVTSFTEIHLANRKGFADANLAPKFDAAGSKKIVQSVIDTVEKTIPASVRELKAKKALFEKSGQDTLIVSTLQLLLNDHDTFSAAVRKKLSTDFARADAAVAVIHDSIQDGIDYFST